MISNDTPVPTLAVSDLDEAKKFYEKMGFKIDTESPAGVFYKSGRSGVFIYPSEFAGTNKATAMGWLDDDVEHVAEDLKSIGVGLEHYDDLPGVTREGDVHYMGEDRDFKSIWFKDPSGNILNVANKVG
jgi:catechol 2,3-dioxygenase-like lactoylglutathione lyase family enzyme